MQSRDAFLFQELKKEIVVTMQQSFPGINTDISQWKGQEITNFQEELSLKVNEHISEKWFYTHMKAENDTLPRIDILNFLSRYAGYQNWDEFKHKHTNKPGAKKQGINPNRYFIILPLITLIVLSGFYFIYKYYDTREYTFCFYDADTRVGIIDNIIEIDLLMPNESPVYYVCDTSGCLSFKTDQRRITMVVKTPYYLSDTIVRKLNPNKREENIMLQANNYALMIHYFSKVNIDNWQKRRVQLDEMIDESALIYQVIDDGETGMELYNKTEFINILTMPVKSLINIEILDTKYKDGKISILRFRQTKE